MWHLALAGWLATVATISSRGAELDGQWLWCSPQPHPISWSEVAFGNGTFVATTYGYSDQFLYTSTDGLSWIERVVPTQSSIGRLDFLNDRFIGVAEEGILSSTDGAHWRLQPSAFPSLWAMTYGNDTYVLVGSLASVVTSKDGENWSLIRLVDLPADQLSAVAFGNGRFVVIGRSGYLFSSEDAANWKRHSWPQKMPILPWGDVALTFHKGYFFYGPCYSQDGIIWNEGVQNGREGGTVRAVDGKLVTARYYNIALSNDGFQWEQTLTPAGHETFTGLAYGNGRYVAVGERGLMALSDDARNWQVRTQSWTRAAKLVFGPGYFLHYGDTNLAKSQDGKAWQSLDAPEAFEQVVFGNDRFVALGKSAAVYQSSDAVIWGSETDVLPNSSLYFLKDLFLITETNGMARASSDGKSWREINGAGGQRIISMAYGNDRFLAYAYPNLYHSADGIQWELLGRAPMYGFRLAFGNGRFLFAGQAGMGPTNLYISEDGREWRQTRGGATHIFDGFGFAAGHFIMADHWGAIYFSRDGFKWRYRRLSDFPLLGFAKGNGILLVSGAAGALLQKNLDPPSANWLPLEIHVAEGACRLSLNSLLGPAQLEQSADLTTWTPLATWNMQTEDPVSIDLPSQSQSRFFRCRTVDWE